MRLQLMLVVGALLACAPPGGDGDEGETDTGSDEVFEEPDFLEPAGGELRLRADRTEALTLGVRGIRPGLTRVFVDELSLGTAMEPGAWIELSAGELTIRLAGSMVTGTHTLQLRTLTPEGSLDSAQVSIEIGAAGPTGLSASMDDAVAFEADAIDAHGHGEQGALMGVDLSTDPVSIIIAPADGRGWALSEQITLPMPGFDRTDEPRFAASATLRTIDDARRLRLVWRTGDEGRGLLGADLLWPPAAVQTQSVIDLDEDFGGYEYTKLGRPLLLGDLVVVEALLTGNVEAPLPGDRTLLTARIDPSTARFGAATISAVGVRHDVERIVPVRDLLTYETGGIPGLGARVAGLRTVVFEVDSGTSSLVERSTGASDRFSSLLDGVGPPQVVLGAFSSRQVFVPLHADGPSVFLRHFDDRREGRSAAAEPTPSALDDITDITAPVTSTVLGGVPVYFIPQGVDAPVVGILSSGPEPVVVSLGGLACDEVAVPVCTQCASSESLDLACRRGREVFSGSVQLEGES